MSLSATGEQDQACAHCGLPAPAVAEGPTFCCPGCRAVWELVRDAGLTDYYELRTRLGSLEAGAAQAARAAEEPAYAHLDDPEVQGRLGPPGSADLHLVGLHCAACVWLIERLPSVLDGVRDARVDFGASRLHVRWDPEVQSLSTIAAFLHRAGYEVHAIDADARRARTDERRRELIRLAVAGASAGNVMLVSFALHAGSLSGIEARWSWFFSVAAMLLALPAVTWGALPFYRAAWAGVRVGQLHLDLPIALGVLGGFTASAIASFTGGEVYFDSLTLLVFLLLVGRWIQRRGQTWALSQTDLRALLVPERARVLDGDRPPRWISTGHLALGDRVEVRAGERVPVDGSVLAGRGSVDASSLTGESRPIAARVGEAVLAGTELVDGRLEIEVERTGADTRVGSLAARILRADHARAPIQRAVDRISGYFVAAVLGLAVIAGVAWCVLDPTRVFSVVVSLLVVSCPCALGLATPVALAIARARAAERGILFGSVGAIERLARVDWAVFDKTGTLTHGALRVCTVEADDPALVARVVRAVEADSEHPVAFALRGWAESFAGDDAPSTVAAVAAVAAVETVETVEELPGLGRRATVIIDGRTRHVRVGSTRWIEIGDRFTEAQAAALERGETPVVIELDGRPAALLTLADTVRPEAARALRQLEALGLRVAVRSGDHPRVVAAVAEQLDVRDAVGGLSPEAKAAELEGRRAAMIGDGVNDAPAMRTASVGVAVRGGAEVALRVADVHLASAGLGDVVELFVGARRTMAILHRNLAFSLLYNLLFAGLAIAGRIDPLAAAVLMPASSLTVVLSSVFANSFQRAKG